eukprot:Hpha_TRINITY_DN18348_c0_g1::TRINITY_DN18348_c0_g1_i1::g.158244::m.158244
MPPRKVMVCVDEAGSEGVEALRVAYHLCHAEDTLAAVSITSSSVDDVDKQKGLARLYEDEMRKHHLIKSSLIEEKKMEQRNVSEHLVRRSIDMEASVIVIGVDNKEHDSEYRHPQSSSGANLGAIRNAVGETTLGKVADPIVRKSTINVCVVPLRSAREIPPQGEARRWLIAVDGSKMSFAGLDQLVTLWALETDEIQVVTLSRHDGKNDQANIAQAKELLGKQKFAKAEVKWVKRQVDLSVGQQLCDYAWNNEFSFLCTSTGQSSIHRLGSVSTYCLLHSKVAVFVCKTPSVDDVIVAERMSGDSFF